MNLVIKDNYRDVLDFGCVDNSDEILVMVIDRSGKESPSVIIDKSQAIQIIKHLTKEFTIEEKELTI
jgi:hypothetical protein